MLPAGLDVDGITAVSILVKAGAYLASLAAAGSALALLGLSRLDHDTVRAVRRLAVAGAVAAALLSALRIPIRASYLMGGSFSGAVDPAILGMVADSPLGTSLWVRLAGLALICLLVVNRPATRRAAGLGAVLVCVSFALRGHALEEPRLVLAALVTFHLMGLAFWIGVFMPLHRLTRADAETVGALAGEFGRKAVRVVAALVAAGAALLVLLTGDPIAALATPYGQLLAVKLCLFAPLLGLAALNKLRLTPALLAGDARARLDLRRSIRMEVMVVLAILVTTATLTTVASPEVHAGGAVSPARYTDCRPTDHRPARAKVAELADALALGASGATRGGSNPPFRTMLVRERVQR